MPSPCIRIRERPIGTGHAAYLIAEAGSNHDGDLDRARTLITAAAKAGADAVKFQAFSAQELLNPLRFDRVSAGEPNPDIDTLAALAVPREWWPDLANACRETGVDFMATPFSEAQADTLLEQDMPAVKISSGDMTHYPLLRHVADQGRPVLLSTATADLDEVRQALGVLRDAGCREVAVLHCVANYPPAWAEVNLRCVQTLAEALEIPIGFSDHTPGHTAALGAVALGACVIEKHFTDDPTRPGADHAMSMPPDGFREMVEAIRNLEQALGDGTKRPAEGEQMECYFARRGLWAARDIAAGEIITANMIHVARHRHGLPATSYEQVVGKKAAEAIPAHHPITESNIG